MSENKKNKNIKNFSWFSPKLEVKKTEKNGQGVFASTDIEKGETLVMFGGYVMKYKDLESDLGDYSLQISEEFVIVSSLDIKESEDDDSNFFNHSCAPNAGFNGQINLVSMGNISAGAEICFDYAMVLHAIEGVPEYSFVCKCGSNNCRKVITENDWKKSDLQLLYKGYFQNYLEAKIRKNDL